jgi:(1->4)-alpha-D-glucan 1-alpha-D-glucosylmutase
VQIRTPISTYRLQFNNQFTFDEAARLVDYLYALGISDCYSSPILKARPGSLHGYDVIDHTRLNPELGAEEQFIEFARRLKGRGMGIVMDVVPNHMCIASADNRWWSDVLENGQSSPYARFFDIDWNPPSDNLTDKILLPILGDQYGRVLENQQIKITYRHGSFYANYYETTLAIAPRSSALILVLALNLVRSELDENSGDVLELESIMTALNHLPPRSETDASRLRERRREKEVIKRRLSNLVKASHEVRKAVHEALIMLNGTKGDPHSFDLLEELLGAQAYRLSYWRVAVDEINYRRFFDINELAAVRVEERPVFTAVHDVIFRLMKQGLVTGLRIDHVDGLFDPQKYLRDVQRAFQAMMKRSDASLETEMTGDVSSIAQSPQASGKACYVIVEKILGHDELLRTDWPVHGTTGYEFMNLLNGVFVDVANAQAFRELYGSFTNVSTNFSALLYESKKLILRVAMSSELHVLTRRLKRISEQHRYSRDFTLNSLHDVLGETIASFPVYRSYVRRKHTSASADDRLQLRSAIRAAKRRNPSLDESIFDFLGSILLLEDPKGLTEAQRAERRDFVMRFQQLTSPVMAKGLEDTTFYRFYPLASLNEVGGDPAIFGTSRERFHSRNQDRQEFWPHSLSASSTHDTKRSEDVRARINVLSEIPEEWNRAIHRWRELNRSRKVRLDGEEVPDANEEYLLYQTLLGAWPLTAMSTDEHAEFVSRIQNYMSKALKEAKLHTSWINPNEAYDGAVREFVQAVLEPREDNRFLNDLFEFQRPIARAGMLNSLSQTFLKITAPGVPDFYQGTEIWDFSLVDPDNRRAVDYAHRQSLLASLQEVSAGSAAQLVDALWKNALDGRIKMYVTSRALAFRRTERDLFAGGEYIPLRARGRREKHVVAFARQLLEKEVIVVASRFFMRLGAAARWPLDSEMWGDSSLSLEGQLTRGRFRDVFTGIEFDAQTNGLPLSLLFAHLPVALLERIG